MHIFLFWGGEEGEGEEGEGEGEGGVGCEEYGNSSPVPNLYLYFYFKLVSSLFCIQDWGVLLMISYLFKENA